MGRAVENAMLLAILPMLVGCVAWREQPVVSGRPLGGGAVDVLLVTGAGDSLSLRDAFVVGDSVIGWTKGSAPVRNAVAIADARTILAAEPDYLAAGVIGVPVGAAASVGFLFALFFLLGPGN